MTPRPSSPPLAPLDVQVLAEVRAGLSAVQKKLPSKLFYDRRGSELFEAITAQPEYYLTRAEREILADWMPHLMAERRPAALVELGAGSGAKTRILLDAMRAVRDGVTYVPLDVSADFLDEAADALRRDYPGLRVLPTVTDIARDLEVPRGLPRPALFAFLGSTIGNFHPAAALRLLRRIEHRMAPGDALLLGADLRKDPAVLHAAYNDAAGVTAEFNRNILRVLNRQLGADFDPAAFAHRAFYNRTAHRIEMHLVSLRDQAATVPGVGRVRFAEGETIRTEISCKYDRATLADLLRDAGLRLESFRTDAERRFSLSLAVPGR